MASAMLTSSSSSSVLRSSQLRTGGPNLQVRKRRAQIEDDESSDDDIVETLPFEEHSQDMYASRIATGGVAVAGAVEQSSPPPPPPPPAPIALDPQPVGGGNDEQRLGFVPRTEEEAPSLEEVKAPRVTSFSTVSVHVFYKKVGIIEGLSI